MSDKVTLAFGIGDSRNIATIHIGDCVEQLRLLPEKSVQTCVTSPPYWGLRDYQTAAWEGGDPDCKHRVGKQVPDSNAPGAIQSGVRPGIDASKCLNCSATRVDLQIGLEKTPEDYVTKLVGVFREVWRVLRDDGTLWLNVGDSYMGYWGDQTVQDADRAPAADTNGWTHGYSLSAKPKYDSLRHIGIKPKDLVGIPWRVALALQADGWYLRQDIIWAKGCSGVYTGGSVMPESVADRCTKAHEYVFLLTKKGRYFFDNEAIKEAAVDPNRQREDRVGGATGHTVRHSLGGMMGGSDTRNRRSVWTTNPKPYAGAHFATFPEALVEPMILAGTSEKGCCPHCRTPWERVLEVLGGRDWRNDRMVSKGIPGELNEDAGYKRGQSKEPLNNTQKKTTVGWQPTCDCPSHDPVPCLVLDPFNGSGTTGAVALRLGRDYVGTELNPEYVKLTEARLRGEAPIPVGFGPVEDESLFDIFGQQ